MNIETRTVLSFMSLDLSEETKKRIVYQWVQIRLEQMEEEEPCQ